MHRSSQKFVRQQASRATPTGTHARHKSVLVELLFRYTSGRYAKKLVFVSCFIFLSFSGLLSLMPYVFGWAVKDTTALEPVTTLAWRAMSPVVKHTARSFCTVFRGQRLHMPAFGASKRMIMVYTTSDSLSRPYDLGATSNNTRSKYSSKLQARLCKGSNMRIILIKLAKQLNHMRRTGTFYDVANVEKTQRLRIRVAKKIMQTHSPLAERLGMHKVKEELDDIAFEILHPEAREFISQRLINCQKENAILIPRTINQLIGDLDENGLTAIVTGREKTPFSIWRKMQKKNITFDEVGDVVAFRIIVHTVQQCYQALEILHSRYPHSPHKFKDYIANPKENGYQSLHTVLIGPKRMFCPQETLKNLWLQRRLEVQIRTIEMEEIAEMGVAAHWQYKLDPPLVTDQDRWLRDLLNVLEKFENSEDVCLSLVTATR